MVALNYKNNLPGKIFGSALLYGSMHEISATGNLTDGKEEI